MRRGISIVILLLLVFGVSTIFAGGGGETAAAGSAARASGPYGELASLPEEIDFVWAMHNNRNAPDGNQIEQHLVDLVRDSLNINLDILLLPVDSYREKINLMITAGEQLDYFLAPNFNVFIDYAYGGGLADLTDYYAEFQDYLDWLVESDAPEEITAEQILQGAMIDGRLYGLGLYFRPGTEYFAVRKDWLEQLGYDDFTDFDTMDIETFYEISCAMRDNDLNGSGNPANTVAMTALEWASAAGALYKSQMLTSAFDVQYDKYLARDGQMVYSDVDGNMREALQFIAMMYEEGLVHTDAPVMTYSQATELAVQGRVGFHETWWIGRWQLMETYRMADVVPEAEWLAIGAITGTDRWGVPGVGGTAGQPLLNQVHAVPANSDYAREAMMLTAFLYNNQDAYRTITYGVPGVHHTYDGNSITLTDPGREVAAANWLTQYRKLEHHVPNPNLPGEISIIDAKFGEYGPDLANASEFCYYWDLLYGITTDASLEYTSDLDTYRDEVFQKITTGDAPIELFDEWVEFWRENGGPEILAEGTEEYNRRYGTSLVPRQY